MNLTVAKIVAKLGKPTRVVGPAAKPSAYLYTRPYGTLHIVFSADYGKRAVANFYMHLVKPKEVDLSKFK